MQTPAEPATGKAPTRRPSDRELLSRFLAERDESAFAELVTRYSRLVMSVALHTLRDPHAAEDAFQATFLVLAKSARRIRNRDSLASWLHGTTFRVSKRLQRSQRRRKEQDLLNVEPPAPWDPPARPDEQAALDEELARLSEGLRGPLVLHYLEGRTVPEIAAELKMTPACVEGRLKRGKQTLRKRLLKRGVLLSSAIFGAGLTVPAEAGVAATLVTATVAACLKTTAAATLTPIAATTVQHIALQEMAAMTRIALMKTALVCCGAAGVIGLAGAAGNGMLGLAAADEGQQSGTTTVTAASAELESPTSLPPVIRTSLAQSSDQPRTEVITSDGTVLTTDRGGIIHLQAASSAGPASAGGPEKAKPANADRERLIKALDQRFSFNFHGVPLSTAIQKIAEDFGINAKVSQGSLMEVGASASSEVNAEAKDITLREALPLILESIPGGNVTYEIPDNGMLTIVAQPKPARKATYQQPDARDQRIRTLEETLRMMESRVDQLQAELALEKHRRGSQNAATTVAPAVPQNRASQQPGAPGTSVNESLPGSTPLSQRAAATPIGVGVPAAGVTKGYDMPMEGTMAGMPGTAPKASNAQSSKDEQIQALEQMVHELQTQMERMREGGGIMVGIAPARSAPQRGPRPDLAGRDNPPSKTITGLSNKDSVSAPADSVREFRPINPNEEHIRQALNQTVDFQFTGQTLQEAMRFVENKYGMTIRLDNAALTNAGVSPDYEVNLVIKEISLHSALDLMLKDVPNDVGIGTPLDYVIEDEVMKITTKEVADDTLQTVIYDLSSLAPGVAEQISTILEKAVEPASWEPAGGKGTIIPVDNSALITTSRRLHEKTAKIIQMLQQHAKATRPNL